MRRRLGLVLGGLLLLGCDGEGSEVGENSPTAGSSAEAGTSSATAGSTAAGAPSAGGGSGPGGAGESSSGGSGSGTGGAGEPASTGGAQAAAGASQTCAGHSDADLRLVGWANENGGTTGGKDGTVITVTTGAELVQALKDKQDSTTPLTILVSGTITETNSGVDKIDVKDVTDVSIIGAGSGGEFNGIGIKIWRASNIVLRNLKIHHVLIGDKDCVSIEGPSDHVWVDHCELYNEYDGVDKDYYDGLLDAKDAAEYITYSWNYLHDSWKAALAGYTEDDTYDRKITMHHNYFRNINSRLPLYRGGTGHVFNNLYEQIHDTGINPRVGACLRIENNYFDTVRNPYVSAFSDVLGGGELICNVTVNTVFDTSSADINDILTCAADVPYDYSAVLNETESVPPIVRENAGVGKLGDPAAF